MDLTPLVHSNSTTKSQTPGSGSGQQRSPPFSRTSRSGRRRVRSVVAFFVPSDSFFDFAISNQK